MPRFSSQNKDLPEVHGCRWKWCRRIFSTYPDLVQHVLSDHVRTFVPIRRQDIAMLRRAEEGVGESLSFPDFLSSQPGVKEMHDSSQSTRAREKSPEVVPVSSLPSPPVSSQTSLSPVVYDDELLHAASSARRSLQRPPSPPNTSLHLHKRHSPPTFASLSSPTGSQTDEMMIDPPTPTFDSLVAQAISANKERNSTIASSSRPVYDSHSSSQDLSASFNSSSSEASESIESSGSHEFVEQQLTQKMDIDEDTIDHRYSSPGGSYHQDQPTLSILQGVTNERTPPIPVRRQAWYGSLPPRRSGLATPHDFGVESEMRDSRNPRASDSTPSQLSKTTGHPALENVFRSGALRFSLSTNGRGSSAPSQSPQPYSQTQSQSPTQASSLEYASYPLQTQAPYQSQSYSP